MEKALIMSIIICVLFGILKFLEMKYLDKHLKPLRDVIRDLAMVFCASFASAFVFLYYQNKIDDFLSILTNTNMLKAETTQVFTGMPDF
jgi:hypothetical protein